MIQGSSRLPDFPPTLYGDPQVSAFLKKYVDMLAREQDAHTINALLRSLVLRYADLEKRLHELNRELKEKKRALEDDLKAASVIQETLLPKKLPTWETVEAAWQYLPCTNVSGDLVTIVPFDDENVLFSVLDVAGHGPRAAMITVALAQFMQPSSANRKILSFLEPLKIMDALDREFPFKRFNSFFTMIYGVLNVKTRQVRMCNAGHPFVVVKEPGKPAFFLEENGSLLGMGLPVNSPETVYDLKPGANLLFYSDGLVEAKGESGELFGEDELLRCVDRLGEASAKTVVQGVFAASAVHRGSVPLQDDFTLLLLKGL